MRGNVEKHPE